MPRLRLRLPRRSDLGGGEPLPGAVGDDEEEQAAKQLLAGKTLISGSGQRAPARRDFVNHTPTCGLGRRADRLSRLGSKLLLLLVVIVLRCARVSKGAGRWNSGRENWTQREGWQQQL